MTHTIILEDPFDNPKVLPIPDRSPEPTKEQLEVIIMFFTFKPFFDDTLEIIQIEMQTLHPLPGQMDLYVKHVISRGREGGGELI